MFGQHVEDVLEVHVNVILRVVAIIERCDRGFDAFTEPLCRELDLAEPVRSQTVRIDGVSRAFSSAAVHGTN